jgi:hypothetical protein
MCHQAACLQSKARTATQINGSNYLGYKLERQQEPCTTSPRESMIYGFILELNIATAAAFRHIVSAIKNAHLRVGDRSCWCNRGAAAPRIIYNPANPENCVIR